MSWTLDPHATLHFPRTRLHSHALYLLTSHLKYCAAAARADVSGGVPKHGHYSDVRSYQPTSKVLIWLNINALYYPYIYMGIISFSSSESLVVLTKYYLY